MGAAKVIVLPARQLGKSLAAQLRESGYRPTFQKGEVNRCPGCGRSHWWIGKSSAECAFCGTALPFAGDGRTP